MYKVKKVINTTKKLIDLPYNHFNLDNYLKILSKKGNLNPSFIDTEEQQPIKLMSGNHPNSGIVTCDYHKAIHHKKRIFIVGKGILFDSGGLNLKSDSLYAMTDDKAGAIIALSVANYLGKNVIAYCPFTTNFIHTSKIIPGDEIKIGNKLVKIMDTDAEGRLILAEAISTLNVSEKDIIITIATLTGSCGYAIGDKATGVMSDNDELLKKYAEASYEAKELAWGLPMFDYMQDFYKKEPIKNYIKKFKGGTSQGGLFIKQFIKYPENFIHLDIAYSAFTDGKANGTPIKSLINFIKKIQ